MKTEKQIQDVLNLRSEKISIRKIADRLNMSPTTVHKYIKIAPSVEEVQPALKIGTAEVTGDVTNNPNDIDWSKLYRNQPLGSIRVRGMPGSEFSNAYDHVQNYSTNCDDRLPRRRGIRVDQPYRESNEYSENLSYDHEYYTPRLPGIPIPPRKQPTLEESITEIKKETDDQKQTRILQSLERKVDKLDKWERDKSEFEKKLAIDQNKKIESGNSNRMSPTNHGNKIGNILPIEESQKTEKLEGKKKFTNLENTYLGKNIPIDDPDGDKTAISDNNMLPIIAAKGFEGIAPIIGNFIGQELYKFKHNNITPQRVKLIPHQEVTLTPIIEVYSREVKKEEEVT